MPKSALYTMQETDRGNRLTISLPEEACQRAFVVDKSLEASVAALASTRFIEYRDDTESSAVTLAVNALAIGRIRHKGRRREVLCSVNQAISAFAAALSESEQDPLLTLASYEPDKQSPGFNFTASVAVNPDIPYPRQAHAIRGVMAAIAMQIYPGAKWERIRRSKEVEVRATHAYGFDLRRSSGSSVIAPGIEGEAGGHRAVFRGNNLDPREEPIVYLAGVVAAARVAELA